MNDTPLSGTIWDEPDLKAFLGEEPTTPEGNRPFVDVGFNENQNTMVKDIRTAVVATDKSRVDTSNITPQNKQDAESAVNTKPDTGIETGVSAQVATIGITQNLPSTTTYALTPSSLDKVEDLTKMENQDGAGTGATTG